MRLIACIDHGAREDFMVILPTEVPASQSLIASCRTAPSRWFLAGVILLASLFPFRLLSAESGESALQTRELQLRQKEFELAMERYDTANKQHVERQRTFHEGIYVAAGLGILGVVGSLLRTRQLKRQQETQIKLKAAEILFSTNSGSSAKAKGRVLSSFFPKELGRFGLGSREYSAPSSPGRIELLRLLAANPHNQKQIVQAYALLFPDLQEDGDLVSRLLQSHTGQQ
jgi:hypothetical protein